MVKVLVAVCTYKRPLMLSRCLQSIKAQHVPPNWQVRVAVVENNNPAVLAAEVAQLAWPERMEALHVSEPRRGISYARNAALQAALDYAADWLIFIDDDEEADSGWLHGYADIIGEHPAEVIHGAVNYLYQVPTGWSRLLYETSAKNRLRDGKLVHSAATDNVMIARKLFADWDLRFDPALAMSGGEDTDFFNRASRRGAKIRYSLKPGVSTLVVAERDNLLWLFRREVRVGAAGVYIDKKLFGTSVALRKHVRRGTRNLIQGIFYLLCSPVLLFGGVEQFRAHFLRSILRFGRGWGALLGLRGKLVTPYKQIEGH